jgi:hypothetical protein
LEQVEFLLGLIDDRQVVIDADFLSSTTPDSVWIQSRKTGVWFHGADYLSL